MDQAGMYELTEKILRGVSFIAIGGALATMFFLVFAQTIIGSRTIHKQLERLLRETQRMNEQLERIARHLERDDQHDEVAK
jgi:hypothetical protein